MKNYKQYVPQTIGELYDCLGSMVLNAPLFTDESGYFPGRSLETAFVALGESLALLRHKLGEENYLALVDLSAKMRAHFEADPKDENGKTQKGRECLFAMEDILQAARRKPR